MNGDGGGLLQNSSVQPQTIPWTQLGFNRTMIQAHITADFGVNKAKLMNVYKALSSALLNIWGLCLKVRSMTEDQLI